MLYVIYGNEPYALSKQVTAYKARNSENIYGFETCKTLADAVTFLTEFNVFCNDRAAYLEVDGISEISNKDSLYVMKKIQDLQDKKLLIYIRKVRSDAKGIAAIKETGCFIREYKKISNITDLMAQMKSMCAEAGACFTEDALKALAQRLDYLGNEVVNLITVDNYINQLKYLSDVVDVSDVVNNVPDMREGKRFELARLLTDGNTERVLEETCRLKCDPKFSGIELMGLLHREFRIAYLSGTVGIPASEQKIRFIGLKNLKKESVYLGLNIVTECMQLVKKGVYTDMEAFDLCITRLLAANS